MIEIPDAPPAIAAAAEHVLDCSPFVAESLQRDSGLLADLLHSSALTSPREPGGALCWPAGAPLDAQADEAGVQRWLRRWRRREMVRIAWRELAGSAPLEETLEDLSAFADDAVTFAHEQSWRFTTARYGTPRYADGREMPMVVVGMGKLGGRELNYSSDIDLVFLFPEYGETDHASPTSHDEFFVRLGQGIVRLLSAPTVDGFVFRVDMRLRPFGDSGPLACGFSAFEDYLVQHGRDWERYAWVKARAITAVDAYAGLYAEAVRPFVFRRYLDFGVFESLREMKQLIEKQVVRRELADHVKLGPGGIREIEFMVQAFQLIRGGQDRRLQSARIFEVLPLLAGGRLLSERVVSELDGAYRYLRTVENRLQMLRDEQTHQLPVDEELRRRLARAMGKASWAVADPGTRRTSPLRAAALPGAGVPARGRGRANRRPAQTAARRWRKRRQGRARLRPRPRSRPPQALRACRSGTTRQVSRRWPRRCRRRAGTTRSMPRACWSISEAVRCCAGSMPRRRGACSCCCPS